MPRTFSRPRLLGLALALAGLLALPSAGAAVLTLAPLAQGSAPSGAVAGGLQGQWYTFDNQAYFSNTSYTDETGRTDAIKNFAWGDGIWSVSDIAHAIQGPHVTGTASSVGAVSYANNVYNNVEASGAYGQWGEDYQRALAPIVGGANTCPLGSEANAFCANEYNYAALFSGFLYVGEAGLYNFGVFADDGFSFSLGGANGSVGMAQDFVAGRDLYELLDQTGMDGLYLEQGYYSLSLSYFNRLEAGVIDLGWQGPGATAWTTIDPGNLYHVPEPATLALSCVALLGLGGARRRRMAAAPTR